MRLWGFLGEACFSCAQPAEEGERKVGEAAITVSDRAGGTRF